MQPKILWPRLLGVTKSVFWAPGTLKTAAPGPRAARARTTRRLFFWFLRGAGSSAAVGAAGGRGRQAARSGEGRGRPGGRRVAPRGPAWGARTRRGTLWSPAPGFLSEPQPPPISFILRLSFLCARSRNPSFPPVPLPRDLLKYVCCTIVYSGIAKNWKQPFYQWGSI